MPKIEDFKTRALDLRPTETGITATAAAARRVGAEYNEAGQSIASGGAAIGQAIKTAGDIYTDYQDHKEKSAGAVHGASMLQELDNDWNKTFSSVKDPNQPGVDKQWLDETLEPRLQDFKQGFTTRNSQAWAENYTDQLRQHFFKKTTADMASRAADAVQVNQEQTTNMLSTTVRNDPTSLDFALSTYKNFVEANATTPNLKGPVGEKLRTVLTQKGNEQIVKNAIMGHIEKTGEIPDWASDPKYAPYVKGEELKQFQQAAKYYNSVNRSQANADRQMQQREARDKFNRAVNDLELSTFDDNGKPVVGPQHYQRLRQIARDNADGAALEPGRLQAAKNNLDAITARMNKPEPLGGPSRETFMRLERKIAGIDGERMTDAKEIYDNAYQLTSPHFNQLIRDFQAAKSPDGMTLAKERETFMKHIEGFIDPLAAQGLKSEAGQFKMEMFIQDARRAEAQAIRDGKDPHLVYKPGSPYYVGTQENVSKYRVNLQDAARARAGQLPQQPIGQPGLKQQIFDQRFKGAFRPPDDWQFNPRKQQYRSPDGMLFDTDGNRIKQ